MSVIGGRAESLAEFVQSYHKISKLPEPNKAKVDFKKLISSLVPLFPDDNIQLHEDSLDFLLDSS